MSAPFLLKRVILNNLKELYPDYDIDFKVTRIGLTNLEFSDLRIDSPSLPFIYIGDLDIVISPWHLLKGETNEVLRSLSVSRGVALDNFFSFDLQKAQNEDGIVYSGHYRVRLLRYEYLGKNISGKLRISLYGDGHLNLSLDGMPSTPTMWESFNLKLKSDLNFKEINLKSKIGGLNIYAGRNGISISEVYAEGALRDIGKNYLLKGELNAPSIGLASNKIGPLKINIEGNQKAISAKALLVSNSILGTDLIFYLKYNELDHASYVSLRLPPTMVNIPDLSIVDKDFAGISISGLVSLVGKADLSRLEDGVNAEVEFAQGNLSDKENKLELRGIETKIEFKDLARFLIPPSQQLKIKRIVLGDFKFEDIESTYSVIPPFGVLIESIRAKWAKGLLYTYGIKIPSQESEINGIIFCDRVNLADVLAQFGINKVEGDGVVSGKVPFSFDQKGLVIEDGVLFSQPGKGGKIRIGEAELITSQLPPSNPLFTQLQFASAALKDFDYDWVNVLLGMKGENLVVSIQLDGTPASKLPFRYNPSKGVFEPAHKANGIRQKMRLDVNLNVPINELLRLKRGIERRISNE